MMARRNGMRDISIPRLPRRPIFRLPLWLTFDRIWLADWKTFVAVGALARPTIC
jgi:hypothetical protein